MVALSRRGREMGQGKKKGKAKVARKEHDRNFCFKYFIEFNIYQHNSINRAYTIIIQE